MITPKQQRFVDEYLIDLNATQAAIRAGYSAATAEQQASRLLRNVNVASAVAERQAAISQTLGISQERVARELALLGFANMLDYVRVGSDGDAYVDLSALTREQAAAIAEVVVEDFKDGRGEDARDIRRVKFKLADKRAALVDLGKHLGMFRERVSHENPDGSPLRITVVYKDPDVATS